MENRNKEVRHSYQTHTDDYRGPRKNAGSNISWGAIIAGAVTFIALSALLSLIGTAIGFGGVNLSEGDPLGGVGIGLVIWTIVSLIISLAGAGFVAGLAAGRTGLLHGFLAWTLSIALVVWLLASGISLLFTGLGNVLGIAGDAAATTVSTVAEGASNLTEEAFTSITDQMQVSLPDNLDQKVKDALANSDVEELHPDYLQNQVDATVEEIKEGGRGILVDGYDAGQVLDQLTSNIEARLNNITSEVNREEVANIIATNTDLSQAEAESTVDNVVASYNEASQAASQAIETARNSIQELSQDVKVALDNAAETTDEVTNEVSKYSIFVFIGLVISAVVAALAGKAGSKVAREDVVVE